MDMKNVVTIRGGSPTYDGGPHKVFEIFFLMIRALYTFQKSGNMGNSYKMACKC